MQDLQAIRVVEGTKISHDYYGKDIALFSYRDLVERKVPAIGIPAKQNGLIIVDVDAGGAAHKHDGRKWWTDFVTEKGITPTYTVQTRSGGWHFYYRLPASINPETFKPPGQLAPGVDLKWNGWVQAPPSAGYVPIYGTILDIVDAPPTLMAEISRLVKGGMTTEFAFNPGQDIHLHQSFSAQQIEDLRQRIEWVQANGDLSRDEWRNGLFSLKAGIDDPELLHELAMKWTFNKSYVQGDEHQAEQILDRATRFGAIGPGTIFQIIGDIAVREGAVTMAAPHALGEILDKAKVVCRLNKQTGLLTVEPSESNSAAILGAMFPEEELYHDIRQDLYIFKGEVYSDTDLVNTITPAIQSTSVGLGLEKFKRSVISGGLDVLLAKRKVDPHAKWLNSIQWDGHPRVDRFFADYVQCEDTQYTKEVSRIFWLSLAARGIRPGCKYDSMVVIEGTEGLRKSSLIEAIGGEYTYAPRDRRAFTDIDELRQMHQSIIVELPELIGVIGQDPNNVKAFMAKSFDHIRGLFARKAVKKLRGFVFVGTTNQDKYLHSQMGTRRFMPMRIPDSVEAIDIDRIKADREQLFAEAVTRVRNGEAFHDLPREAMKKIVAERVAQDPIVQVIHNILLGYYNAEVTIASLYTDLEGGGFIKGGLTTATSQRIEEALHRSGYAPNYTDKGVVWRKPLVGLGTFI